MKPLTKFSFAWWACWWIYGAIFHPFKSLRIVCRWLLTIPGVIFGTIREISVWITYRVWTGREGANCIMDKNGVASAFCKGWEKKYNDEFLGQVREAAEAIRKASEAKP